MTTFLNFITALAWLARLASQFAPEVIRGPLVPFKSQYFCDPKDIEMAERVAARIGIDKFGAHGFSAEDIEAAIAAEGGPPLP